MALSMTDNKISDEDRKLLDLIHNDPGLIAHYRKRGPRFETLVLWGILTTAQIVAILGIILGSILLILTRGSEDQRIRGSCSTTNLDDFVLHLDRCFTGRSHNQMARTSSL